MVPVLRTKIIVGCRALGPRRNGLFFNTEQTLTKVRQTKEKEMKARALALYV